MGEEVAKGYGGAQVRHLREVDPNVVVQGEAPLLRQEGHGKGRELLGCGPDIDPGVRGEGDPVAQVGHPPGPLEGDPTPLHHGSHHTGGVVSVELREDGVEALAQVGGKGEGVGADGGGGRRCPLRAQGREEEE
jgi:hypothetical protein